MYGSLHCLLYLFVYNYIQFIYVTAIKTAAMKLNNNCNELKSNTGLNLHVAALKLPAIIPIMIKLMQSRTAIGTIQHYNNLS